MENTKWKTKIRLTRQTRSKQYLDILEALFQGSEDISEGEAAKYNAIAELIAFEDTRFTMLEAFQLAEAIEVALQECERGPVKIDLRSLQVVVKQNDLARIALGLCSFYYDDRQNSFVSGDDAENSLDVLTINRKP